LNEPKPDFGALKICRNVEHDPASQDLRVSFRTMAQFIQDPKAIFVRRLRALARNLDAISKGHGRPRELIDDFVNAAESLLAFDEAFNARPDEELIRRALAKLHEEE